MAEGLHSVQIVLGIVSKELLKVRVSILFYVFHVVIPSRIVDVD